jgi:hypothetical protein
MQLHLLTLEASGVAPTRDMETLFLPHELIRIVGHRNASSFGVNYE